MICVHAILRPQICGLGPFLQELVSKVQPDAIVVELSRDRISSLYPLGATHSRRSGGLGI